MTSRFDMYEIRVLTSDCRDVPQERLAALDLEAKRADFERSTAAYEASRGKLSGKEKAVGAAQADADAMRTIVNDKARPSVTAVQLSLLTVATAPDSAESSGLQRQAAVPF